ncbi:rod-binding protein [Vibrio sp. CDRSL-10 TSBA]
MKIDHSNQSVAGDAVLYHDNSALANIKHAADKGEALQKVAGQFEAMFLQLVLRQMRSSSDALADQDSPFSSQQQGVFRDMYDGQLAIELAKKNNAGIADMLVRQLGPAAGLSAVQANSVNDSSFTAIDADTVPVESVMFSIPEAESQNAAGLQAELNPAPLRAALDAEQNSKVMVNTAFAQPLIRPWSEIGHELD